MSNKIESGIIILLIILAITIPIFILSIQDIVNQYEEEPEFPDSEGFSILSDFFLYLIDYLVYFSITFVDELFQRIINISLIEIYPLLGAISSWILFIEVIVIIYYLFQRFA